jgi:hypothetical protein
MQPAAQEVKEVDSKAEDGPFVKSPVAETLIQQLHRDIVTPKDDVQTHIHSELGSSNSAFPGRCQTSSE